MLVAVIYMTGEMDKMNEVIVIKCISCKEDYKIKVKESELKRIRKGELIQNVLSHLSIDEREILISRICSSCYDRMFMEG